jgi:hypothetical protein
MLLVSPMLIALAIAKSPGDAREMIVRLGNSAVVPPRALREAEISAEAMLARAGVHVQWVDCSVETCAEAPDLWIQFVERRPANLHTETAGYTILYPVNGGKGGYAVVAWRPVAASASEQGVDPGPLLGAAMVHEIGHLLLGRDAHARSGVMVPHFRRHEIEMAARGELGFTDEQAKQIRAALVR